MSVQVSVIIPTYNRDEDLARCLVSLFAQDYPRDQIELIVINDGGKPLTQSLLVQQKAKYQSLTVLYQENSGPAVARNLGIRSCRGQIICFIDDDCVAGTDWVSSIVRAHEEFPEVAAIGGLTETATHRIPVLLGQFLANGSIETQINGRRETIFFPTCNLSFKRHVLQDERFDEAFPLPGGEDLELSWRLYKKGYRFVWKRSIVVIHYRNDSMGSCMSQAYTYGRGNFLVQYLHHDHPLLKELQTAGLYFWWATLVNALKIPRFSYMMGKGLIQQYQIQSFFRKAAVYTLFALHKVFYIVGNITEFIRLQFHKPSIKGMPPVNMPSLLILDITHACNLSCRICDIWQTSRIEKDMSFLHVKSLLAQAQELGIKEIALSGGEVLLRKDIFEIIDSAKALGIKNLGILSNGILMCKYWERLKPYLLDNTITPVISLDSLQSDVHNHIRNSDVAWQETSKGLQALSALKKEHPQVHFNIITIILNDNLEELPAIVAFANSIGADSLQFQALLPNNLVMSQRKGSPFWVEEGRWAILDKVLEELIMLKQTNPHLIRNSRRNLELIKEYYRGRVEAAAVKCRSAESTILISNRGQCTTCFSVYGDISKQTLKQIIMDPQIVKAREGVSKCASPCLLPCFCD